MPRLLKITALLLATLWLPATMHCQLETLGFDSLFGCMDQSDEASHGGTKDCTEDGCQTVESGQVLPAKARLDVASLTLIACACQFYLFEVPAPMAAPEFVASRQDLTLPLQRTWQFDRRAAAPPRAPGSLNA